MRAGGAEVLRITGPSRIAEECSKASMGSLQGFKRRWCRVKSLGIIKRLGPSTLIWTPRRNPKGGLEGGSW